MRTKGLSPKIIAPVATALSAFIVAKVHDEATAYLLVAIVGAVGLYVAPAGEQLGDAGVTLPGLVEHADDLGDINNLAVAGSNVRPDAPPVSDVTP